MRERSMATVGGEEWAVAHQRVGTHASRPEELPACGTLLDLELAMTTQQWPDRLWIVRHGESAGNIARDAAYASGQAVIDIAERDVDVPLSALGQHQSRALGG